ncbi:MAG: hypothetical protein QXQ41_01735 [Candidatus Bathyarchaeia archaeon]
MRKTHIILIAITIIAIVAVSTLFTRLPQDTSVESTHETSEQTSQQHTGIPESQGIETRRVTFLWKAKLKVYFLLWIGKVLT